MTKREAKPENICFLQNFDFQNSAVTKHATGARRTAFDRSNLSKTHRTSRSALSVLPWKQRYIFAGIWLHSYLIEFTNEAILLAEIAIPGEYLFLSWSMHGI
jgi:hypothetical protein